MNNNVAFKVRMMHFLREEISCRFFEEYEEETTYKDIILLYKLKKHLFKTNLDFADSLTKTLIYYYQEGNNLIYHSNDKEKDIKNILKFFCDNNLLVRNLMDSALLCTKNYNLSAIRLIFPSNILDIIIRICLYKNFNPTIFYKFMLEEYKDMLIYPEEGKPYIFSGDGNLFGEEDINYMRTQIILYKTIYGQHCTTDEKEYADRYMAGDIRKINYNSIITFLFGLYIWDLKKCDYSENKCFAVMRYIRRSKILTNQKIQCDGKCIDKKSNTKDKYIQCNYYESCKRYINDAYKRVCLSIIERKLLQSEDVSGEQINPKNEKMLERCDHTFFEPDFNYDKIEEIKNELFKECM